MKILIAGSPEISVRTFEKVINNFDVVAVLTQPDKPKGRGMKLKPTPVAELAKKYNILTFKPNKVSDIRKELEELDFDLLLSFAFGQWIPSFLLNKGKYKPMNIHGSLLPKYRGAAPIHYAILNGDSEIGITFMEMIKEMDAGDMYFKASRKINESTTTGEAFKIIESLAEENIIDWLRNVEEKKCQPMAQNDSFTLSPKIEKSFGELNEDMTVFEVERRVRGLNPFPGSFMFLNEKRVKIFDVSKNELPRSIKIKCKDGFLFAIEYQKESKKRVKL